ncbi:hypothetical protein V8C34DRAFT_301384 [Trichoderma compactum]
MAPKRPSQRLNPTAFEGAVQNDSGVAHSLPPQRRRSQRPNPSPPKDVALGDSGIGLSPSPELVNLIPPEDMVQDDSSNQINTSREQGPFGSVMHVQWHYPTYRCRKTNVTFGHVVDPSNPSLRQQVKKLGSSINISTSDMIPFRNISANPL